MTDHDVAATTPPNEDDPERSIAEQLVEQARADGVDLVGPGGVLSNLTKQVLETGLEVEMEEHLIGGSRLSRRTHRASQVGRLRTTRLSRERKLVRYLFLPWRIAQSAWTVTLRFGDLLKIRARTAR